MSSKLEKQSIEHQYKKASKKCQSYTACTGCSIKVPHPSEFDECYKDPLACMEEQANGLFKMREQPMDMNTRKRLQDTIQNSKQIAAEIGEQEAIEFLADAELYCNKPHTDTNILNFCKQAMQDKTTPAIPNMNVQIATDFINKRQREIDETLK